MSIAYHAPAHYDVPQGAQSAGFSYTVIGLESGTAYDVTITAKDADGTTLNTETASFTTTDAQAVNQITNDKSQMTNKVLHNGMLLIERNGRTYTATGQEIK